MRTFDAKYPQPKSKAAPIHPRSSGSLDDDLSEEDEEEYEEMVAEAAAKRDRLSERLIVSAAAAAASQAASALPPLSLNRATDNSRRQSYPSPLTEHSFSQDDSDMYWNYETSPWKGKQENIICLNVFYFVCWFPFWVFSFVFLSFVYKILMCGFLSFSILPITGSNKYKFSFFYKRVYFRLFMLHHSYRFTNMTATIKTQLEFCQLKKREYFVFYQFFKNGQSKML